MSFPTLPKFGLVDNPLLNSPFVYNNTEGSVSPTPPGVEDFLLLSGMIFELLSGLDFLLL